VFTCESVTLDMSNKTYHCIQCNKEFLDKDIVKQHHISTNHEIKERVLEK
jgi:DNA-directed RNA polymerase subunit RPC12/RpoP